MNQEIYNDIRTSLDEFNRDNRGTPSANPEESLYVIHDYIMNKYPYANSEEIRSQIINVAGDLMQDIFSDTFKRFVTGYSLSEWMYANSFRWNPEYIMRQFAKTGDMINFYEWAMELTVNELLSRQNGINDNVVIIIANTINLLHPSGDCRDKMEAHLLENLPKIVSNSNIDDFGVRGIVYIPDRYVKLLVDLIMNEFLKTTNGASVVSSWSEQLHKMQTYVVNMIRDVHNDNNYVRNPDISSPDSQALMYIYECFVYLLAIALDEAVQHNRYIGMNTDACINIMSLVIDSIRFLYQ